jgi:hypothetical protein
MPFATAIDRWESLTVPVFAEPTQANLPAWPGTAMAASKIAIAPDDSLLILRPPFFSSWLDIRLSGCGGRACTGMQTPTR